MRKAAFFIMAIILAVALVPETVYADGGSYVVGRITGTHHELPGFFFRDADLLSMGIDEVEIYGFRLIHAEDGSKYLIRPNRHGYFYQELPGGEYTLTRNRKDRPGYREPKTIDILKFKVEPGTIVNLGTLDLVLDGKPKEKLRSLQDNMRGVYLYRYHYERKTSDRSYERPLNWFKAKRSEAFLEEEGKILRVKTNPSQVQDSSEIVLETIQRFSK